MEQPACERCEFIIGKRPVAVHTRRSTRGGVFKGVIYFAKLIIAFVMSLLHNITIIGKVGRAPLNTPQRLTCFICLRREPKRMIQCENCHLKAHEKCILEGSGTYAATVDTGTQTEDDVVEISSARAQTGLRPQAEEIVPVPGSHVGGQTRRNSSVGISAEPTSQRPVPVEAPAVSTTRPQTKNLSYTNAWDKRLALFSRFDRGIMLDKASFRYSCPETLAAHIAQKCSNYNRILDPFCGAGSNAIQLALLGHRVIAIDRDPKKIILAKKNADIYGVSQYISFRVGDCYKIAERIKADAVVTSPPWGTRVQDEREMSKFLQLARKVTTRVVLNVQNNTINHGQCLKFARRERFSRIKIEKVYIDGTVNYFTFYLTHDTDVRGGSTAVRSPNTIKNDIVKLNTFRLFNCEQIPFCDAMASYHRYLGTVDRFLDKNKISY